MISNNYSSLNFNGKYQINANQNMENKEACLKRDYVVGFWANKANNGDEIQKKFKDFVVNEYDKNQEAPCNLTIDINDNYDKDFEESMNIVGQKFNKLA